MTKVKEIKNSEQFKEQLVKLSSFAKAEKWEDFDEREIIGSVSYGNYGSISLITFQVEGTPVRGTFIFKYDDERIVDQVIFIRHGKVSKLFSCCEGNEKAKEIALEIYKQVELQD